MDPATIAEFARCAAIVHAADHFDFQRYGSKLLIRSTQRPGPKPNREHQRKIADAAITARWLANNGRDKDQAATEATVQHGLSRRAKSQVYRAAFDRKDPPMNKLIRKRAKPRK
jgi:hypothetical protein